jgi:hypothetical protein
MKRIVLSACALIGLAACDNPTQAWRNGCHGIRQVGGE